MGDLSYVNCLKNDMLNCLYFIKKAYVISMIHEMKLLIEGMKHEHMNAKRASK
jgi:hypothetical protein